MEINKILEYQFPSGKTIVELLHYEGYSYWWDIDFGVYLRYLFYRDSQPTKFLYVILKVIDKFPLIYYIIRSLVNLLHKFLNKLVKFTSSSPRKIHPSILYFMLDWEWRDDENGYLKNIYHSDIIDYLLKTEDVTSLYDTNIIQWLDISALKKIYSKKNRPNLPTITDSSYCSLNDYFIEKKAKKHFSDVWDIIDHDDYWFNLCADTFKTDNDSIREHFRRLILYTIPRMVVYHHVHEKIIQIEKPSAIVMRNEQMVSGRTLVTIARKYQIPTIGIQHGGIAKHPAYLYHNPTDVAISGKEIGTSFPIPDITCVWGESERKLLVDVAGYPSEQVAVTGNPRYDYLSSCSNIYSKDAFCKKYGIDTTDYIILWTTQSHGFTLNENETYLNEVLSALSDFPNITLIIKQHPNEPDNYKKLIEEYVHNFPKLRNVIIPDKMTNTTEMVYVSDLLINCYSTTGQEAVAFHKPMIILDFSTQKDRAEYVKEGVGIPVYSPNILRDTILSVFEERYNLINAQDAYISNHMYKLDGRAAQRIADVVIQNIKN